MADRVITRGVQGEPVLVLTLILLLSGCFGGSRPPTSDPDTASTPPVTGGGGFFGGDRPPDKVPANLDSIPDAVPGPLPLSQTGNKPYVVFGKSYKPIASATGYKATGTASWYGKKFHGRRTSSGEPYDMFGMTAAHTVLPLPSFVRVTNLDNDRSVVVKVNDRGPFLHGRLIDLSYAAAHRLRITAKGTGRVSVVGLDNSSAGRVSPDRVSPDRSGTDVVATETTSRSRYSGIAGEGLIKSKTATVGSRKTGDAAGYLLQVGVFSDLVNALTLRSQLRRYGLRLLPPTDRSLAAGEGPYRVVVGPFSNRNEAEQIRRKLSRETGQAVQWIDG